MMHTLSCVSILAILVIAITNSGITVNGFIILRNQLDNVNNIELIENDNNGLRLIRAKRSPQRKVEEVYSPKYGEGYYVFPDAPAPKESSARNVRRQQSNLEYRPLLTYKALKTKKKRLFVPNLFG